MEELINNILTVVHVAATPAQKEDIKLFLKSGLDTSETATDICDTLNITRRFNRTAIVNVIKNHI